MKTKNNNGQKSIKMKKILTVLMAMMIAVIGLSGLAIADDPPMADYGDAPDPSYPSLYNTTSTTDPNRRGPYHIDVSQEWIGTSPVSATTVEIDALVPDRDFDDGAIPLERALIDGSSIAQGYVTVPITISASADTSIRYLNVAADLDQGGTWQAYSPSPGITQEEWVRR